jgi:hypothetical protein
VTVIACTLEEMAADSLCHEDDTSHYHADKMMRLQDGSIIGGAGNHPEKIMDWIRRGSPDNDRPEFKTKEDDFSILHLTHDGIYLYVNSLVPHKLKEQNYAIGCGGEIALYCMRVQKMPPVEAVRETLKINLFCGGEVDCMRLAKVSV